MSDRPRLCSCVRVRLGPILARSALAAALIVAAPLLAAADTDQFSFSAEQMETVLAEGRERTVLTGSAALTSDDTEIFAERIELYGDDLSFALSQGGVRVVQVGAGIELTSETVFYNRRDGIVRVEGDALLIDHDNEMVIKGGFLEHWEERDETSIQIGVQILSDDLVARAQLVHYDRGAQTLALSGLPVVTWKGDEYRASRIFIDLDQDRIVLSGAVSGQITPSSADTDDAEGADDAEEGAGEEPDAAEPAAIAPSTDDAGPGDSTPATPATPADREADG
jgi:lipopolysaccharide export system protein LptA